MQRHNFAIVFKSTDPEALNKALEYIRIRIPDSLVVFRTGPTDCFLWILEGKRGGVSSEFKRLC